MNAVQVYALQSFLFNVGAAALAVSLAALITTPITRRINAASDKFWARVDARRVTRQR